MPSRSNFLHFCVEFSSSGRHVNFGVVRLSVNAIWALGDDLAVQTCQLWGGYAPGWPRPPA